MYLRIRFAATADTLPVWAVIALAFVTGGFGLLAGAAAAAVVNTSYERKEKRRDRMTDAIIDVEATLGPVAESLAHVNATYLRTPETFDSRSLKANAKLSSRNCTEGENAYTLIEIWRDANVAIRARNP
jgi:hypothetical protein